MTSAGNRRVGVGGALVLAVVGVAVLGPFVAPHGETDYVGRPNSGRLAGALFGTDFLGQDIWSRFLLGGRSLLLYAVVATALGVAAGVSIGLVSAFARGVLDQVLMRSMDVMLALPQFLLVLVAMTTLGPEPWLVIAAIAVTALPRVARVTRGAAVAVVDDDYVQVSEALGESTWHILRSDIMPNISGTLLVEVNIRFVYSIGIIASLSFLGLTPEVNGADWGVMVQENRGALTVQPWGVILPMIAIVALAVGSGLVTDGIATTGMRVRR